MRGSLFWIFRINASTAAEQAHDEEQDDCSHDSHNQTGKVEASHALSAEELHNVAAKESADNTHNNVGNGSHLPVLSHNDACDPTGDGAKDDPYKKVHFYLHRDLDGCLANSYQTICVGN